MLVICCLTSNAHHAGYVLSMTRLLRTIFGLAGYRRYKAATNVLLYALLDPIRDPAKCFKFFSDKHCMQDATSSTFPSANDVIELCWILYNKTSIIATSFFQRTTAFTLCLIVPSLQISCFRKTKEKQYAKYDLNKRIAARLI